MCSSCRGPRRLYAPLGLGPGWRSECYSPETDLRGQRDSRKISCHRRSAGSPAAVFEGFIFCPSEGTLTCLFAFAMVYDVVFLMPGGTSVLGTLS